MDQLEDRFDRFGGILSTSAQATLPKSEARAKQKWMTLDILQKMERRRLDKSSVDEYNKLDAEIRRKCQTAMELMLTAQYDKIEQLDAPHKSNQVHAQIRQATDRKQSACVTTCIEDKDGNIIMEQAKILVRWYEYISELYDDNRREIPQVYTENELTPVIRREVEFALKGMPLNNAPGPDNIFTEMIVASGEAVLTELTSLTNLIYQEGCFLDKINNSIFITLPKVRGTAKCEKHRTISLMSHVTNLVLRVLINRLRARSLMGYHKYNMVS